MKQDTTPIISTPVAIIIAGVIIAGAVLFTSGGDTNKADTKKTNADTKQSVRPLSQKDHVYGNPDAPISLIEFSDFECPYCARVHPILKEIVDESDGEVNWVYRHFPLANIHTSAVASAVAGECIAKLGGNDAFWAYTEQVFDNQRNLSEDFFAQVAVENGISEQAFRSCFEEPGDEILGRIQTDLEEVQDAGGRGTPFTVVKTQEGTEFPVPGAVSKQQFLNVIADAQDK